LYVFYALFGGKLTFFVISLVRRTQNDVQDDVMRDAILTVTKFNATVAYR